MHTIVLIFVGGFCLGLIAFGIQVLNSPVATNASEQQIQQTVGIGVLILSIVGFILSLIYFVLNYRFHAKKDWGGIDLEKDKLTVRHFNNWFFSRKEIQLSTINQAFRLTKNGQQILVCTLHDQQKEFHIPITKLKDNDIEALMRIISDN